MHKMEELPALYITCRISPDETIILHQNGAMIDINITFRHRVEVIRASFQMEPAQIAKWDLGGQLKKHECGPELDLNDGCGFIVGCDADGEQYLSYYDRRDGCDLSAALYFSKKMQQEIVSWFNQLKVLERKIEGCCQQPAFGL